MRRLLQRLYLACGALAAAFMIAIVVFILYAIGGSLFGYMVRAADEYAGYSMAASSFLALAYTFGKSEHIRITLAIHRLRGRARRWAESWALGAGTFFAGYFAYYSVRMAWTSWILKEVSQGLVPTPLWIPQIGMALGTTVLAIAMLEKFIDLLRGGPLLDEVDAAHLHMER